MAESPNTLFKRIASGLVAALSLIAIGYFGGHIGLVAVVLVVIGLSVREYARMMSQANPGERNFKWFFSFLCVLMTAALVLLPHPSETILAAGFSVLIVGGLWLTRNRVENDRLLSLLSMAMMGLIYCVYFPVFAIYLAELTDGPIWFIFLLAVVFFGDTFAYFGGRLFGKRKLMPNISPNKTIEGAVSGIFGSCLAGTAIVWSQFPSTSLLDTILFCAICGFIAQAGDLFVSLIKRVAKVKDSGHIMPGHGGILDRLDGVYIACPLVYTFAQYCQNARIF